MMFDSIIMSTMHSWELELVADVTTAENSGGEVAFWALWQFPKKVQKMRPDVYRCPLMYRCINTKLNDSFVCLFPEAAKTAVSTLKAVVQLPVTATVHKRTPLNIQQLSHLVKGPFSRTVEALDILLTLLCFQLAVLSATGPCSCDCTVGRNNAVEHHMIVKRIIIRLNVQKTKLLLYDLFIWWTHKLTAQVSLHLCLCTFFTISPHLCQHNSSWYWLLFLLWLKVISLQSWRERGGRRLFQNSSSAPHNSFVSVCTCVCVCVCVHIPLPAAVKNSIKAQLMCQQQHHENNNNWCSGCRAEKHKQSGRNFSLSKKVLEMGFWLIHVPHSRCAS